MFSKLHFEDRKVVNDSWLMCEKMVESSGEISDSTMDFKGW